MGATDNKSGEEKQRLIPKLTADNQNGDSVPVVKETESERVARINKAREI